VRALGEASTDSGKRWKNAFPRRAPAAKATIVCWTKAVWLFFQAKLAYPMRDSRLMTVAAISAGKSVCISLCG